MNGIIHIQLMRAKVEILKVSVNGLYLLSKSFHKIGLPFDREACKSLMPSTSFLR